MGKKRVTAIGDLYDTDSFRADFMIEEIVRDYGTHLITSVDFGAILFQDDHIERQDFYKQEGNGDSYTFGLKVTSPFASGSIGGHHDKSDSKKESYEKSRRGSALLTHGGKVQGSLNVSDWLQSVPTMAVPIDRNGIPIENIFNEINFPAVLPETLRKIRKKTQDVVLKYYDVNGHHGCMDPRSPNFDFKANINDDSCGLPRTDYAFGGFFQEGELFSGHLSKENPLTGGYNCPKGYNPRKLYEHTERKCTRHCSGCMRDNPRTNKKNCPSGYKEDTFFPFSLCWQVFNENTRGDAMRFGGIFSCEADIPYGVGQGCPANYSKVLITIAEPRCSVYYCTQLVESAPTPRLIHVPFRNHKIKSTKLSSARKVITMEHEKTNSFWVTILGGGGAAIIIVLLLVAVVIYKTHRQQKNLKRAYNVVEDNDETCLVHRGEVMHEEDDTLRRRSSGGGV